MTTILDRMRETIETTVPPEFKTGAFVEDEALHKEIIDHLRGVQVSISLADLIRLTNVCMAQVAVRRAANEPMLLLVSHSLLEALVDGLSMEDPV